MRPVFLAVLLASAPAVAQPSVVVFSANPGVSGPTNGVTTQPDIATVVGPVDILDLSTGHASVASLDGTAPPSTMSSEQFWTAAGIIGAPNAFEHRAVYDPVTQRFFVSADELVGSGANRRYLAVSTGSTAAGPWQAVALPATAALTRTRLAVDNNGVYLASDGSDGLTHVTALPLGDAIAGPPSLAHASALTIPMLDAVPALDAAHAKQPTDPEYFAARSAGADGDTTILVFWLTWNGTTAAMTAESTIDLGAAFPAPPATAVQPAPPLLDASDDTLRSVVSYGNTLYGVAATTAAARAAAFWFSATVDPGTLATGTLSLPDTDVIVPALAVDTSNDVAVIAVATSSSQSPMPVVTGFPAAGGQFAMPQLTAVVAPAGSYACGPADGVATFGRTSAISVVPSGAATFVADAMYGGGSGCAFSTTLAMFAISYGVSSGDLCCFGDDPGDPIDSSPTPGCSSAPSPRDAAATFALVAIAVAVGARRRRARR